MILKVLVASPDGKQVFYDEQAGPVVDDESAARLGQVVGLRLRSRVPPEIFL
jgi:hydroxymethylbilane synthase